MAERFGRTHDERADADPHSPSLHEEDEQEHATDAANEAALSTLQRQGAAAFRAAVRRDLAPLAAALLPLANAQGVEESRARAESLQHNLRTIEAAVLDGNAATAALEVSLATEFLRGLASLGEEAHGANAGNPYHDGTGRFTHKGGARSGFRETQSRPRADEFGTLPDDSGYLSPDENLERGQNAMRWVVRNKGVVRDAMHIPGLGSVTFAWGNSGIKDKGHVEGYGFYHIIDKHGHSAAKALPHTLAFGRIYPHPTEAHKRLVFDGTNLAATAREPKSNSIAITSFERPSKEYLASLGIHT